MNKEVYDSPQQPKKRLLIHHHHTAFQDADETLWLSSVIGRWVIALTTYFEVELLLYQSQCRYPKQDTPIPPGVISFTSLGPRKSFLKNLFSNNHHAICMAAGKRADYLLIRGITPHQYRIWRATPAQKKLFLLVGSFHHHQLNLPASLIDMIIYLLGRLRLWELRQMDQKGTCMMANSPHLVAEIEQYFGHTADFVPTNSLRETEFAPLEIREVSTPVKLMYCGRLDLKKGLRELFHALDMLRQKGWECELEMVGSIDNPIYDELSELAKELEICELIRWHGLIPYGADLFQYYQNADAVVLPSYSEGFPHVIWEAFANCCPVITTAVGGIPALITEGEHALLIRPRNVEAIVEAVKRLFSEDSLREKLVIQAYDHAKSYTVEACAAKLANVLAQKRLKSTNHDFK